MYGVLEERVDLLFLSLRLVARSLLHHRSPPPRTSIFIYW